MNNSKSIILTTIWIFLLTIFSPIWAAKIDTVKPKRGSIQKYFTEPAKTHLEKTYTINMPIDGELERVKVREGDKVKKGDLLVQMEQEPLEQALNKAIAYLNTIKAQLALQKKTVKRYTLLSKRGFIEKAEFDEAVSKEKTLMAEIAEANSSVAIAKYNLQQSSLFAPVDGVVLNRYSQGGRWLSSGTALLRIGNLDDLEVICDVLTQEAQELKFGDKVFLSSVGTPVVLEGRVKQIYPAGFTKKSSLGVDEQRVNVIVSIEDPKEARLGLGYRVQAKFLVGAQEKEALIVPRFSVLQDGEGNHYVFVVKRSKIYKKIIKLGILTDEQVSVLEGLSTKDVIVAQPTAEMKDGDSL